MRRAKKKTARCTCRRSARLECDFAEGWISRFCSGPVELSVLKSLYEEERLKNRPALVEEQIKMDVVRTLPELGIYKEGTADSRSLFEVLASLASRYPELGYVQGMNCWVAALRFHIREDHLVFWTASYLIDTLDYSNLCGKGRPG